MEMSDSNFTTIQFYINDTGIDHSSGGRIIKGTVSDAYVNNLENIIVLKNCDIVAYCGGESKERCTPWR